MNPLRSVIVANAFSGVRPQRLIGQTAKRYDDQITSAIPKAAAESIPIRVRIGIGGDGCATSGRTTRHTQINSDASSRNGAAENFVTSAAPPASASSNVRGHDGASSQRASA